MFRFCPNEFIRIELGCIRRETMNVQPLLCGQKLFDDIASMDAASIPDQFDVAPQVTQKVPQELEDFLAFDVGGVELSIESQTLALGRHGDAGDRRNSIPCVAVPEQGRLAHGRPGFDDVGDEQESAFVEERQMSVTLLGFFLYSARWFSSSARWLLRPAALPASRVSASSTEALQTSDARRAWSDNEYRIACESRPQFGSKSTSRWSIRQLAILSVRFVSTFLSAVLRCGKGVLCSVSAEVHAVRASGEFDSIGRPNLSWRSAWPRRLGRASRLSASRWHDVFVFLAAGSFHGVSCLTE
jgi:hypothetical protein